MLSNFLGLYPAGQFNKEAAAQIEALKVEVKAQRQAEEEADRKAREQAAAAETKAGAAVGQFLGTKRAVRDSKKKKQKTATAPRKDKRKNTGRRCGECCPNRAVCWDRFYYCGNACESKKVAGLCDSDRLD